MKKHDLQRAYADKKVMCECAFVLFFCGTYHDSAASADDAFHQPR